MTTTERAVAGTASEDAGLQLDDRSIRESDCGSFLGTFGGDRCVERYRLRRGRCRLRLRERRQCEATQGCDDQRGTRADLQTVREAQ